jgi:hypothetical protein
VDDYLECLYPHLLPFCEVVAFCGVVTLVVIIQDPPIVGEFVSSLCFVDITLEPPIEFWSSLQACTGSITTLKGPIVDQVFPFLWEGSGIKRCAIVTFRVPCASTLHKGVNFGAHHRLNVPRLFLT